MNLEQQQELLINLAQNGEFVFGAVAWNGYLQQGRGYLYAPLRQEAETVQVQRVIYVALHSPFGSKVKETSSEQTSIFWKAVESYTPETDFILLLGFPDQESELWTQCQPSVLPSVAYSSAIQRPQEFDLTWMV